MHNARWWEHNLDIDKPPLPSLSVKIRKFLFWKIVFPFVNRFLDAVELLFKFTIWLITFKDESGSWKA